MHASVLVVCYAVTATAAIACDAQSPPDPQTGVVVLDPDTADRDATVGAPGDVIAGDSGSGGADSDPSGDVGETSEAPEGLTTGDSTWADSNVPDTDADAQSLPTDLLDAHASDIVDDADVDVHIDDTDPATSPEIAVATDATPDLSASDATTDTAPSEDVDAAPDSAEVRPAVPIGSGCDFALPPDAPPHAIVEVGHEAGIACLWKTATRVVSLDRRGAWSLWDFAARDWIAGGTVAPPSGDCGAADVRLVADMLLVREQSGLNVRDAGDGHVLATIPLFATSGDGTLRQFGLASDASYVWTALAATPVDATALSVWSPDGTLLFSRAGDYGTARVFAAPAELRVGLGPAGASVFERIGVPSGDASTSLAFLGTFASWFRDGAHFLTTSGTTVSVYGLDAVRVDVVTLTSVDGLEGDGEIYWTPSVLRRIGRGAVTLRAADSTEAYQLSLKASTSYAARRLVPENFDLLAVTPTEVVSIVLRSPVAVASPVFGHFSAMAIGPTGAVVVGATYEQGEVGVIFDQARAGWPLESLGCGGVLDMAAADTGQLAIALGAGAIAVGDVTGGGFSRRIDYDSSHIELSADGTVLVAQARTEFAQYRTDRSIVAFSLPTGEQTHLWQYNYYADPAITFALARAGDRLLHVFGKGTHNTATPGWILTDLAGTVIRERRDANEEKPLLSPSGNRVALQAGKMPSEYAVNIYIDGALMGAASGRPMGWLDEDRLLVATYAQVGTTSQFRYDGAKVIDIMGTTLALAPVIENCGFEAVSPTEFYAPAHNAIFDIVTGAATWTSTTGDGDGCGAFPPAGVRGGIVAGNHIVYRKGRFIFAEPF